MKHPFTLERGGRVYHLVKHTTARKLPPAEMTRAAWFLRFTDPATGRPTWRKCGEHYETELAVAAARELLTQARAGANPFRQYRDTVTYRQTLTLARLLSDYQVAGCPDTAGKPRTATALADLQRHCRMLITHTWAEQAPASITEDHRDAYVRHRAATVAKGDGLRTAELELVALNSALQWAWRRGHLESLPRSMKATYRDPAAVTHARDFMPTSGDELHTLAGWFTRTPETQVYCWATLLGAYTGLRLGELQMLRASPQRIGVHVEPGWYDDRCLIVPRTKRRAGKPIQDEFALNDSTRAGLRPLLDQIRQWKALNPNPEVRGSALLLPMAPDTLTKQLHRATADLELPERHAHGLRAYYVSVRLAAGISSAQVAVEVGHTQGGDHLVRTIYGATPPQWRGLENVLTWLPTTPTIKPAWELLQPPANLIAL